MVPITLEQIIRAHVPLPTVPSSKGWYHVLCKVCNDHGRKGDRGGFKFEGDVVSYNCFNCHHGASFDPSKHKNMPSKMKTVLESFGISKEEWQQVLFSSLKNKLENGNSSTNAKHQPTLNLEPLVLPIPKTFYHIEDATKTDKWAMIAKEYLLYDRGIDPDSYPFMLSTQTDEKHLKKWMGRLIIPIFKDGKLIYYQGRDLTNKKLKKYESPTSDKDNVIFGFEEIFKRTDEPLYIIEGVFDAMSIEGVAVLGNKISSPQIAWLNRSTRKKVYIPDRFGDGHIAAQQALDQGWYISTPDIGSCKDMNAAVMKYGKLYVMKTLTDNTYNGFNAQVNLGIYCK